MAAPSNDLFADAISVDLVDGTFTSSTIDNAEATRETGEPEPFGTGSGDRSVWFSYTPAEDVVATFDTVGSTVLDEYTQADTVLAIYTGSSVDALTPVASNDDTSGSVLTSRIADLTLTGGTTYHVQVGTFTDHHIGYVLTVTVPVPLEPVGTDLTFGNYGYGYTGETDLEWIAPPAAPLPGTFPSATIARIHHAPGAPVVTADGRHTFGFGTEAIDTWCDYLRVTISGLDVTFFRGAQVVIHDTQSLDPYGDGPASLSFPSIGPYEAPGEGDLWWLTPTARVVINKVLDGVVIDAADPYWLGMIAREALNSSAAEVALDGAYIGRESRLLDQPYITGNPARTLKDHLIRVHEKLYRYDFRIVGNVTGPLIRARGDRSTTRLGRVDYLLGMSDREDGGSYTLLPDRSVARNAMRLQLRSMSSPSFTIDMGAHGVELRDFARDPAVRRVYGQGQSPDGGVWRNICFPMAGYDDDPPPYPMAGGATIAVGATDADTLTGRGISLLTRRLWTLGYLDRPDAGTPDFDDEVEDAVNEFRRDLGLDRTGTVTPTLWGYMHRQGFNHQSLQGVHFEPLAADTETVQWLRGPGGVVVDKNPNYDRDVFPVEEWLSAGESTTKAEGRRFARARLARAEVRVGTVILHTDPAEMSRFDIKGGMTGNFKNLAGAGAGGLDCYVSSAQRDHEERSVTLAIATSALHFADLQSIRQRQVEARKNVAKRGIQSNRRSLQTRDTVTGWDSEGPSGILPRRLAHSGHWNKSQVVACERGTIAEGRFVADDPTPHQILIFGQDVDEDLLDDVIGNPFVWHGSGADKQDTFQLHHEWLVKRNVVQMYGSPDQPGGYYPRQHTNDRGETTAHPVTGVTLDDNGWPFSTKAGFLYHYVWVQDDTIFHGRLKLVPEE